jgi:hypothetical protein
LNLNPGFVLLNDLDIDTVHLRRQSLVLKLADLVDRYQFLRLTSPAASGKTSLVSLFAQHFQDVQIIYVSFMVRDMSCKELLFEKGVDLKRGTIAEEIRHRRTIIFIDDAQEKYEDLSFWRELIKISTTWLPKNIQFVIISTHLLIGDRTPSPTDLAELPRLDRKDFLLSHNESKMFLESPIIGLPQNMQYETLIDKIAEQSGGLIGALRRSVDFLRERFGKDTRPSEVELLQNYLSEHLMPYLNRCFSSRHSYPIGNDFKMILKKILANEKPTLNLLANEQDNEAFSFLKMAGILVDDGSSVCFSSPLAKRFYFQWIFPNRSATDPESIFQLIKNAIASMSATILKCSTPSGDFPKEAVFQHLFMQGLALNTTAHCHICPELSKKYVPDDSDPTINGEIDFYLNGKLRWGIELLVNGEGIGEHISRFEPHNGKYVALGVNDYVVVDFRRNTSGNPTNIRRHPKRISVFFKADEYSSVECIFGENQDIERIKLSD